MNTSPGELEVQHVQCVICRADSSRPFKTIDGWDIVECATCKLRYLNPRPSNAELLRLYNNSYFRDHIEGNWVTEHDRDDLIRRQIPRVVQVMKYQSPGQLLDVGCGSGFFLAAARRFGWEVRGVELSEWAASYATERLSVPVLCGPFESANFAPETFDVITMHHTLEHMVDPQLALELARDILKPGGYIVVTVPNCASFEARFQGNKWRGWDLPFHLYHFTPQTLSDLLRNTQFEIAAAEYDISPLIVQPFRWVFSRTKASSEVLHSLVNSFDARSSIVSQINKEWAKGILGRRLGGRDMTYIARKAR